MDKDRIKGAAKQAKGKMKEFAGKVTGDEKTKAEGKADKAEGKLQNAYGGLKDKAREALDHDKSPRRHAEFPQHRFAGDTSSLIAGALFVVLSSVVDSRAQSPLQQVRRRSRTHRAALALAPWRGAPLRVMFAAEKPLEGELSLIAPDGSVAATSKRPARRAAVLLARRSR